MIVTQMIQKVYLREVEDFGAPSPDRLKYEASEWGELILKFDGGRTQKFLYCTGKQAERRRELLAADGWKLGC